MCVTRVRVLRVCVGRVSCFDIGPGGLVVFEVGGFICWVPWVGFWACGLYVRWSCIVSVVRVLVCCARLIPFLV